MGLGGVCFPKCCSSPCDVFSWITNNLGGPLQLSQWNDIVSYPLCSFFAILFGHNYNPCPESSRLQGSRYVCRVTSATSQRIDFTRVHTPDGVQVSGWMNKTVGNVITLEEIHVEGPTGGIHLSRESIGGPWNIERAPNCIPIPTCNIQVSAAYHRLGFLRPASAIPSSFSWVVSGNAGCSGNALVTELFPFGYDNLYRGLRTEPILFTLNNIFIGVANQDFFHSGPETGTFIRAYCPLSGGVSVSAWLSNCPFDATLPFSYTFSRNGRTATVSG